MGIPQHKIKVENSGKKKKKKRSLSSGTNGLKQSFTKGFQYAAHHLVQMKTVELTKQ